MWGLQNFEFRQCLEGLRYPLENIVGDVTRGKRTLFYRHRTAEAGDALTVRSVLASV